MKYRFIEDLTSDVMFEAYGKDLKGLFENAALALFSVICQIERVGSKIEKIVEIKSDNIEGLMYEWLQELISIVDIKGLFFSKFEIIGMGEKHLKAKCYGEEADPEKGGTVVKAVTYYKYLFEKTGEGYRVRVSLDI